jgi:hypothetical protein
MENGERAEALKALNTIQYNLFQRCISLYEKGRFNEFWNEIESLDRLFNLSNKILQEERLDS